MIANTIKKIEEDPKKIFILDGIGAIVTALFLGIILVQLEKLVGIPVQTLYCLAVIPVFFMVYDYYCYQKENNQIAPFLKGIAILNLMYCILSLGLAFYHIDRLTVLGWTYVLIEILILIAVSVMELKFANKLVQKYS